MDYDQRGFTSAQPRIHHGGPQRSAPASYAQRHDQQFGGNPQAYGQEQSHGRHNGYNHYVDDTSASQQRTQGYQQGYDQYQSWDSDLGYQQRPPQSRPQPQGVYISGSTRPNQERRGYDFPGDGRIWSGPQDRDQTSQHHRRIETYEQRQADGPLPPRKQSAGIVSRNLPNQQSAPKQPAKMTMAEWKAAEKAKMHAALLMPETLAQDNAFPTFPGWERDSRPSSRNGGHSAMSNRTDGEIERPGTVQAHQTTSMSRNPQDSAHPGVLATESYDSMPDRSQRPESKQRDAALDREADTVQAQSHRQDRQIYVNSGQPAPLTKPAAGPTPVERGHDRQMHINERQPGPPMDFKLGPNPTRQEWSLADSQQDQTPVMQRRPVPTQSGNIRPTMRPIDTAQPRVTEPTFEKPQLPIQTDGHQRPSVLQGVAPASSSQISPLSVYSEETTTPWSAGVGQLPPKPWQQLAAAASKSEPSLPTPMTREQEIEAEMPDFDSAARNQTSALHKRIQTIDQHLAKPQEHAQPPMPTISRSKAVDQSWQSTQDYQNLGHRQAAVSQTHSEQPEGQNGGFAFGFEEQQMQTQASTRPGNMDHGVTRPLQQPVQQMPYRQRPTQPSGVYNGTLPRRSAEQARTEVGQPHYGYPGSQPGRGAIPAHVHRPDLGRNYSGETVFSEPGIGRLPPRAGNEPQRQQGIDPSTLDPRQYSGPPLSQQRSNPERRGGGPSNPDALPPHPTPVRLGSLNNNTSPAPAQPAPVRQYGPGPQSQAQQGRRQPSVDTTASAPVTHAELDQLRQYVTSNPQNPKQALVLVKKLAEAASVLASEGGRADAKQTAKNREKYALDAHKRLKKLVASGYPDAQFYMGDCFSQGMLGLPTDAKEAFSLYLSAAKSGHPQAAFRTALCCELGPEDGGGTRKDPQKAVQWYKRAAALGDGAAMYKCGIISLKALMGQPKNVSDAVNWLKRAVERVDKEHPHALHELATLHEPGNPDPEIRNKVIPDENYARELFFKAAKLGFKPSQVRLGQAYEYGQLRLPIDNRASISWYSKAAAQGEHHAELALSGWYLTGAEGILEQSDTEAYLWARKAASSEPPLAKAMFAMGYFTEMGIGCPQSLEEARRWYGRAAAHKFPKAMERIEELKKSGTRAKPVPHNGKLTRKDQKRDEAECVMM